MLFAHSRHRFPRVWPLCDVSSTDGCNTLIEPLIFLCRVQPPKVNPAYDKNNIHSFTVLAPLSGR